MRRAFTYSCAILAALFLLAAGGASAAAPLPIEAFGSLPFISQPKLSPDGRHFAVIQAKNGRPAVVIYEVGAPPDANPAVLTDNSALISDIRWASNDRLL